MKMKLESPMLAWKVHYAGNAVIVIYARDVQSARRNFDSKFPHYRGPITIGKLH